MTSLYTFVHLQYFCDTWGSFCCESSHGSGYYSVSVPVGTRGCWFHYCHHLSKFYLQLQLIFCSSHQRLQAGGLQKWCTSKSLYITPLSYKGFMCPTTRPSSYPRPRVVRIRLVGKISLEAHFQRIPWLPFMRRASHRPCLHETAWMLLFQTS